LKEGAKAPFFIPAKATEIHQQPAFLRPKLRPKNAGGTSSGLLLGLDRDEQQHQA
jgi:hypothetical protein